MASLDITAKYAPKIFYLAVNASGFLKIAIMFSASTASASGGTRKRNRIAKI
jgi:hypothetical protein